MFSKIHSKQLTVVFRYSMRKTALLLLRRLLLLLLLPLLSPGAAVTFGDEPYQGTKTYAMNHTCDLDGLKGTCNAFFCTVVAEDETCAFIEKTCVSLLVSLGP
jgi:hypothetical protein